MSSRKRTFKAGDYLFREGDPSQSMFVIESGVASIEKRKNGGSVVIARVHSKEVLGELSFFDRRPRSASARAMTDLEALEIEFEALDKIYAKVPDYIKTMMAAVAERLRRANNMIRRLQEKSGASIEEIEEETENSASSKAQD